MGVVGRVYQIFAATPSAKELSKKLLLTVSHPQHHRNLRTSAEFGGSRGFMLSMHDMMCVLYMWSVLGQTTSSRLLTASRVSAMMVLVCGAQVHSLMQWVYSWQ